MNKITKRIILVVVTVLLAVAMQAVISTKQVKAEVKNGEVKGMKWSFDTESGTLELSGETENYSDFFKAIGIDAKAVKTLKVGKDVEYLKFNSEGCENVTTVELESEKTLMFMDSATYGMKNLTTVKHGESVVEKYDANSKTLSFSGNGIVYASFIQYVQNVKIETIKIEDGITAIEERAKLGRESVKTITLPESLVKIGNSAFAGAGIENIELPSKLKTIGYNSFDGCTKLKKIELPDSVEEVGDNCFDKCEALEEIKFSSNLEEIRTGCFARCDSLKEVTLPKNIKEMAPSAFTQCENLTKITIENAECEISGYFDTANIKNLAELKMGDIQYKFDRENGNLEVSGSKKIVNADSATRAFGQLLIKKLIVKDAEEIGDECFNNLSKVENVELPDSLKIIGKKCFRNLETLSEITLSKNIEEIGEESFKDCKELTIKAEEKSEAYEFAEENDINVEAIKKSGLKLSGAIIGIIIGCVVAAILFIVLIVVIILVIKSKKKKQAE